MFELVLTPAERTLLGALLYGLPAAVVALKPPTDRTDSSVVTTADPAVLAQFAFFSGVAQKTMGLGPVMGEALP